MQSLLKWKERADRRPLIIQGARQIGKTWIMKKFGATYYKYVAYFNFDASDELVREFDDIKTPDRIIERLSLYCDVPLNSQETLIIFDEVQQCSNALNSLKYFCEDAPEYHIIAAGSLLGVAIHHHRGFPVGKVEFLKMYPISFREYLRAIHPDVIDYLDSITSFGPLPEIVSGKLWDAYRAYQICGGMPKAAVASIEKQGMERIVAEQDDILNSFFYDFTKHAPVMEFPKISAVWQSLPSQLTKENRKFIYKVVKPGARAREYENALAWLREAGLIYQIFCCTKPGLPLSAYDDLAAFKIYMLDTGLLRALAKLPPEIFTSEAPGFIEFKGAMCENMILQALVPQFETLPRYWVSNGTAEVDFIIQNGLAVVPLEVKAAHNVASKSLGVYIAKFNPETAIIYSSKPLNLTTNIKPSIAENSVSSPTRVLNIPLPLADWTQHLLSLL